MATTRLYINPTIEKQLRSYCDANGIEDVNAFANRCALQGLNILKYGVSPSDNIERENKGIKDIVKDEKICSKEKNASREDIRKQENQGKDREENSIERQQKEEVKTTRKIRIIKKG